MTHADVSPRTNPLQDPRALGRRTRAVAAPVLVVTAAFIVAKTGRDALYFSGRGIFDLPRAYVGIAFLALPMAAVALGLMRWLGPRRARVAAPLLLAGALGLFARVARPGGGGAMTAFFMVVTLAFGVLFSMTWLLAADVLAGAPRELLAHAYGTVGAASILGGMLGGLLARALATALDPRGLVLLAAGLLVIASGLVAIVQRRYAPRALARPEPSREVARVGTSAFTWSSALRVLREPYTGRLVAVAMLAAAVGVLIEFQFYLAAASAGQSARHQAGFFANAYLLLNGTALLVQLVVLPRLQRSLGLGGALLVLPGVLLGGGTALLVSGSAALRAVLRITEGGLKSSVHRTTWEQAYLPFGRAQRSIAKLIIDGSAARIAEGLVAGALLLWMRGRADMAQLTSSRAMLLALTLVGCVATWILATIGISSRAARLQASHEDADLMVIGAPLPDS